jgi:hypothetical protein
MMTTGQRLPASPMSASQISPCFGSLTIENAQYFLFHLTVRQHVLPRRLFALADEKPQEMQYFQLYWFGLVVNLVDQQVLRLHNHDYTGSQASAASSPNGKKRSCEDASKLLSRSTIERPATTAR